jgi:uncharacterized protein YukE
MVMSASPCGDPEAIGALASACYKAADQIRTLGDDVHGQAERSSEWWRAPRADRFRSDMAMRQKDAYDLGQRLQTIAGQLKALAGSVDGELSFLSGLEAKVLSLFKDFVPIVGVMAPWAGTPWSPTQLPATGDPAWRSVARDFGIT